MNDQPMTQLPDGRWVPAQPLPFYEDTRPWYVRLYHAYLYAFRGRDLDELIEPWYVPKEPLLGDLSKVRG